MTDWISGVSAIVVLLLLAVVAIDRNRLRHRLDHAEGQLTGLTLDLEATRELVGQLQAHLSAPSSWDVDAVAPDRLTPATEPDRWTPRERPATRPSAGPASPPQAREIEPSDEITSRLDRR